MANSTTVSNLRLWVDDQAYTDTTKKAPDGWMVALDYPTAIDLLGRYQFIQISLDHDLGCFIGGREYTGNDILHWLIQRKQNGLYVPKVIDVHTNNSVAGPAMRGAIERYLS